MDIHFSGNTMSIMIFIAVTCTLLPLIYLGYFRAKTHASFSSFFIGIGFSVLFSFIGESLFNTIVLFGLGLGNFLRPDIHPVYTAIYFAIVSGTLAQTGSFIALKYCMKKRPGRENALVFGLGKGGFECIIYGGVVYITNIILALMVNAFGADGYLTKLGVPEGELAVRRESIATLASLPTDTMLLDGSERVLALLLHASLVIFVYMAMTHASLHKLFPIAIGLHIIGYLPVYLSQTGIVTNHTLIMVILLFYSFGISVTAYRLYHDLPKQALK
ncbi:MAG: YhfC family intramembrane metalloprotease [Lachnospiraceae bacterium]|nr:YhfC family intramembrane metalloprotease [Lachnospiraceae bacterium]